MNDCKYGYSVRDNNIGLSLLKAPKFPNHLADMCEGENDFKEFIYSALPHERALEDSNVFTEALILNTPLKVAILNKSEDSDEHVDF